MEEYQKLRLKSAMIIYALEESLGNYIIQNEALIDNISDDNRNVIIEREKEKGNEITKDNIKILIESSYLNEIFNFAIDITENTSLNSYMKELKQFCSILGVFDIRNAVSHPNRPFPDFFWYRAATIASDPLIEKLNLLDVKQALNSAVLENLNPPPEDWFNNVKWAIPNSLPNSFDHEITGLLGRDKEFKDLKNVLSKVRNNLIAIVAPGGVGKTALVLQFLKDLSLSPEWSGKIESILYCTLKNERLTANGIEIIEAINGLDQIKESILTDLKRIYSSYQFETFDEACSVLENKKILLCIDNLETLLMNSQLEFIEFNQSLPIHWRVMVTSRISIDSATTVPLEPLLKRHAVNLARNYFRKRGVNNFTQEDLERITDMANNNPLAIRLTIDLYLKGIDISQSIEKSQKDIAFFSYKNLIESLKENSISILEAIYSIGEHTTKPELIELLGLSSEEIVECINELSKTSLIIRATSEFGYDSYKLSDSIRDLLLINPKNIEVRTKIASDVKKRKTKILEQTTRDQQLGINEFDEQFVEKNTDHTTHILIVDLNKFLAIQRINKNLSEIIDLKKRFQEILTHQPNSYQLYYHYSRIFRFLKDKPNELSYLQKAIALKDNAPRISLSLALHYFYDKDFENAELEFKKLIDKGYNRPLNANDRFSYSVSKCYLQSLLNQGKYKEIIDFTKDWENDSDWFVLYGTHRATSFKRSVELKSNDKESEKYLSNAIDIFKKIFLVEGYEQDSCLEAFKLVKSIDSIINSSYCQYSDNFKLKILEFISNHFIGIAGNNRNINIASSEVQGILSRFYDFEIEGNPMQKASWYKPRGISVYDQKHIDELISEGYTIVEIYHIPPGDFMPNYLFAKDIEGHQYYLKVDYFEGGWNKWGYLELDTKLAIKYTEPKLSSKSRQAIEIVEIDQFEE